MFPSTPGGDFGNSGGGKAKGPASGTFHVCGDALRFRRSRAKGFACAHRQPHKVKKGWMLRPAGIVMEPMRTILRLSPSTRCPNWKVSVTTSLFKLDRPALVRNVEKKTESRHVYFTQKLNGPKRDNAKKKKLKNCRLALKSTCRVVPIRGVIAHSRVQPRTVVDAEDER